jgi:hypothetical protein
MLLYTAEQSSGRGTRRFAKLLKCKVQESRFKEQGPL